MEVDMRHCGSSVQDTYLWLLNSDGTTIASNDNYTGPGQCADTHQARLKLTLPAGTYFIVSEGYSSNSYIVTTVMGTPAPFYGDTQALPINAGTFGDSFTYSNTQNTYLFGDNFDVTGAHTREVYYRFAITRPMAVAVSVCGSTVSATCLSLLNSGGTVIASDINGASGPCGYASAYITVPKLAAGTYYAVAEGRYMDGVITTNITAIAPIVGDTLQNYTYSAIPKNGAEVIHPAECIISFDYYDGLGRLVQSVAKGAAPDSHDIVTPVAYDRFGRQAREYLPYKAPPGNSGNFRYSALTEQQSYYAAKYPVSGNNPYAFSETVFEAAPQSRPVTQFGAGAEWRTANRAVHTAYRLSAADEALKWTVSSGAIENLTAQPYPPGQLFVVETTDEDGRKTLEYSTIDGLLIRRRQLIADDDFADTDFAYNVYNELIAVIPPKVPKQSGASFSFAASDTTFSRYVYGYRYDGRSRQIEAHTPGAGWRYTVYNPLNRPVLTQDAVQRAANEWSYTKYDEFGRIIITGVWRPGADVYPQIRNTVNSGADFWETADSAADGYTNVAFPTANCEAQVINFYDSYDFDRDGENDYSHWTAPMPDGRGQGKFTGNRVKMLRSQPSDPEIWLMSATLYDARGRIIHQYQTNPDGGYNREIRNLNFLGQPARKLTEHKRTATASSIYVEDILNYDHAARLTDTYHSYNSADTTLIARNTYDDLGTIQSRTQHNNRQHIDYQYNIRGWLTQINEPMLVPTNERLFGERLMYNDVYQGTGAPQYAGNIAAVRWWSLGANAHLYSYTYDRLGRLQKAIHDTSPPAFNLDTVIYDRNGNITALRRYGSNGSIMDDISLTLDGNRLSTITELFGTAAVSYDAAGNMLTDSLRMRSFEYYPALNLPKKFATSGGYVQERYSYDALGTKWRITTTVAVSSSTPVIKSYCGPFVYSGDSLVQVLNSEGFYKPSNNTYYYLLKDHLGNVRTTYHYSGTTAIVDQQTDYYPFGQMHPYSNLTLNRRLFGGKELLESSDEYYDFGARIYDSHYAHWTTPDPLGEKYAGWSGYNYCLGNPIRYFDPEGEEPRIYVETQGFGHAFVTAGVGDNTIVYTYGRYGELGKDKSSARGTTPTGEGVLIRLTGNEAKQFIQDRMLGDGAVAFEFTNGSDELVMKHFDNIFNASNKVPTTGKYADNENARVIDKYNLFIKNCVTTSVDGVQSGVKENLKLGELKGPMALKDVLNAQSQKESSGIKKIPYEDVKKELKLPNEEEALDKK